MSGLTYCVRVTAGEKGLGCARRVRSDMSEIDDLVREKMSAYEVVRNRLIIEHVETVRSHVGCRPLFM